MSVRRRVKVHGAVQGVYFRNATRREASRTGVSGWAENCPDGSVEVVMEGDEYAIEQMISFLKSNPGRSRVDDVEVEEEDEWEGLVGFEVL